MRAVHICLGLLSFMASACQAQSSEKACQSMTVKNADYTVCQFDPAQDNIRLHLRNSEAEIFGDFNRLKKDISEGNETFVFGMNGGMYHQNREPVGLYIEDGVELQALSTKPGAGNFHMLPNGVFWIWQEDGHRGAHVRTTKTYQDAAHDVVNYATQSGPMLVIDGELHPRFLIDSTSLKIRNGVGLVEGDKLVFAISDTPVNFHQFASLFRDTLGAQNALYLDGTISRIYSKDMRRNDKGLPMGPIISVTQNKGAS